MPSLVAILLQERQPIHRGAIVWMEMSRPLLKRRSVRRRVAKLSGYDVMFKLDLGHVRAIFASARWRSR
jgi:hypothetical protein